MRSRLALLPLTAGLIAACSSPAPAPAPSTPAAASPSSAASAPPSSAASAPDWPSYHGTADRGGVSTTLPAGTAVKISQSLKLDGPVYASPLAVKGLTIAATENDSVYAFDQSYKQVWKTSLGTPSPAEERQCGNIDPLGITGTPIYDAGTGQIYVVAEQSGSVRHELSALDLRTGKIAWSRSVDLPGVSPRDMQQRGALAITKGKVWISYGAQAGDCGDYKGRVVGVNLDGSGAPVSYTPPTKRGGGIWNPNGPTVTAEGNLLVVSANGAGFPGDAYDHTNSVLELDGNAKLVGSFAPSDWAQNNRDDVGLGSQGVSLIGGKWAMLGGKSGPVYVLKQGALGGINGQTDVQNICKSFGGAAVNGNVAYLPCLDGVRAVQVDDAGKLKVLWHADSSITGSPVIGGGRIWALDSSSGILHALDPATGKTRSQVTVGPANRFATPALYASTVIIPTLTGLAVVTVT